MIVASSIVFGTLGSGKTYYLVRYILKNRKRYQHIVTNFPVYIPGLRVLKWDSETGCQYINSGMTNTLYVLDEAWGLWGSRNFEDFDEAVQEWFSLSRHYNNHILLATQAVTRLDKIIRELSQDFVFVHSWKMWFLKRPRPLWFTAEHYDRIVEDTGCTGISQPLSEPLRVERFPFSSRVARKYDTYLRPPALKDSEFNISRMPAW